MPPKKKGVVKTESQKTCLCKQLAEIGKNNDTFKRIVDRNNEVYEDLIKLNELLKDSTMPDLTTGTLCPACEPRLYSCCQSTKLDHTSTHNYDFHSPKRQCNCQRRETMDDMSLQSRLACYEETLHRLVDVVTDKYSSKHPERNETSHNPCRCIQQPQSHFTVNPVHLQLQQEKDKSGYSMVMTSPCEVVGNPVNLCIKVDADALLEKKSSNTLKTPTEFQPKFLEKEANSTKEFEERRSIKKDSSQEVLEENHNRSIYGLFHAEPQQQRSGTKGCPGYRYDGVEQHMHIWVITNFSIIETFGLEHWSEAFYLGQPGYRLRAKIEFTTNYLGLFIKLVTGAYDNQLVWPFCNEIQFLAVDQTSCGQHIARILKPFPDDGDEAEIWVQPNSEVTPDEMLCGINDVWCPPVWWGHPNFINRKILQKRTQPPSRYIENDQLCLAIRLL